jgi:hypothetical protein
LNELVQVLIHRHTPLVQVEEFILQLEGATGHIVSSETSLELILGDSLDVGVGVAISLPPVYSGSKYLVRREENLLTIRTLGYLQLLLN